MTDPQVAALIEEGPPADFTGAERAAIAFGEEMTREPAGVGEAVWQEVRKHWDERQIVEIAAVAALFNSFNRFNNALQVDLTVYPEKLG